MSEPDEMNYNDPVGYGGYKKKCAKKSCQPYGNGVTSSNYGKGDMDVNDNYKFGFGDYDQDEYFMNGQGNNNGNGRPRKKKNRKARFQYEPREYIRIDKRDPCQKPKKKT